MTVVANSNLKMGILDMSPETHVNEKSHQLVNFAVTRFQNQQIYDTTI